MPFVKTPQGKGNSSYPPLPIISFDYPNGQRLTVTSTAVASAAINAPAVAIKVNTDVFIQVGAAPVATVGAGSFPLFAGETLYTEVPPGHKVSVIRVSTDGNCTIMPLVAS